MLFRSFISSFTNKSGSQLQYPFSYLSQQNSNPKVSYHPILQNKYTIGRNLIEYHMITTFANKMQAVSMATILGDQVFGFPNTRATPDCRVTFANGVVKDFDVKNTNMRKHGVFSGYIQEIAVYKDNSVVAYPRDYTNYQMQYEHIKKGLENTLNKNNMTYDDVSKFKVEFNYFKKALLSEKFRMGHDNLSIENHLNNINQLKSYPLTINSYNVYQIQDTVLSDAEMRYLQNMAQHLNPNLLNDPSFMKAYLIRCLHEYKSTINPNVCTDLLPIKKCFPFITEFLNYYGHY